VLQTRVLAWKLFFTCGHLWAQRVHICMLGSGMVAEGSGRKLFSKYRQPLPLFVVFPMLGSGMDRSLTIERGTARGQSRVQVCNPARAGATRVARDSNPEIRRPRRIEKNQFQVTNLNPQDNRNRKSGVPPLPPQGGCQERTTELNTTRLLRSARNDARNSSWRGGAFSADAAISLSNTVEAFLNRIEHGENTKGIDYDR
jgi:hypothetical protein